MEKDTADYKSLPLNDLVWHLVVQLFQLAIMSGVDVVDYLRQIRLSVSGGELTLADGQRELFEKTVNDLLNKVNELQNQLGSQPQQPEFKEEHSLEFGELFKNV